MGSRAHLGVHVLQLPPLRKHVAVELGVPPVVLPHLLLQGLVHQLHVPGVITKQRRDLLHHVMIFCKTSTIRLQAEVQLATE